MIFDTNQKTQKLPQDDRIKTLTSIVINQQRSLSQIDYKKRRTNIISGLTEINLTINGIVYNAEEDKITKIVSMIGYNEHLYFLHVRIGKTNPAFNRIIKVTVPSQDIRDKIIDQAKSLHDINPPFSKIYIKKDLQPVIHKENKRLHNKMKFLKSCEENEGKNIKAYS